MSYAAAYTLYNYRFEDPAIGDKEYSNLRLVRAFEQGLDPSSSEAGFVLTHVDMVKYSSGLIRGSTDILNAIASRTSRSNVLDGFETMLETMRLIEASMETMWANSRPKDYITYRTFIFGITNQSMFPNGVVYEGENDNEPMSFRGESGANDSIIPLLDSLLQIPMPQNPLTDILKDFRSYRPKPHREFLSYVRRRAEELEVRNYCCADLETAVLYLRLLDHVRSFRWRHWLFAREYIIRRSSHPTATGGSPIVTWLPNQLFAVMELMSSVWDAIATQDKGELPNFVFEMMDNVADQKDKLRKEVDRWCSERGVPVN
jgi:indoleamine 2,3-dioxygenase